MITSWWRRYRHYTSTYCQHGVHGMCRLSCKICAEPCRCLCHRGTEHSPHAADEDD